MRWQLSTGRQTGTRELRDVNTNVRDVYIDVVSGELVQEMAPAELADRPQWFDQAARGRNKPDLCYDIRQDALVGVRDAKLAVFNAGNWVEADKVSLAELRELIDGASQVMVPLSQFVMLNTQSQIGGRQVKPNAPSVVVQSREGNISVFRVMRMSVGGADLPVIMLRRRPLAPYPPIHSGDTPEPARE
jgi:hypothetical protein